MPRNTQLTLFDLEGKEPPKKKVPTLHQWLKQTPDVVFPIYSTIEVVFFPGTFDNYTFYTNKFRLNVTNENQAYSAIDKTIVKTLCDCETAINLVVIGKEGNFRFEESTVYGAYKPIGSIGYRFEATPT